MEGDGPAPSQRLGIDVFAYSTDAYKNANIKLGGEGQIDVSESTFNYVLQKTVGVVIDNGCTSIWMTVPFSHIFAVPLLREKGFETYYAKDDYIVMRRWLPDTPSKLPHYASHFIGAGGFVTNKKGQVLVIREKLGLYKGWKLPGGLVDQGEDLAAAIAREVWEETGIQAEVESIVTVMHTLHTREEKSDLYFVGKCRAVTDDINIDPAEIEECKWMNVEEFKESVKERKQLVAMIDSAMAEEEERADLRPVLTTGEGKEKRVLYSRLEVESGESSIDKRKESEEEEKGGGGTGAGGDVKAGEAVVDEHK